jgi:hypothetical protein
MAKTEAGNPTNHRRGRPPGDPESVRHRRVVTLVTDAEYEKLTKSADENEKSISALVHQIVWRYLMRRN